MLQQAGLERKQGEAFTTMQFKNVIIENPKPGISLVKISRPKALNALNTETLKELKQVFQQVQNDNTIRVLIVTGDGEKSFVAGADILEMHGKAADEGLAFARLGQEVTKMIEFMPKPVIAAVNGYALGGGTELAIACDFIIASDKAVFGQPEVGLGIIPGFGGTVRLGKHVGFPMAKEIIFSGRKVKADEALRIGLINRICPASELMSQVLQLAEEISRNSLGAVAMTKRLMNGFSETCGIEGKLEKEAEEFSTLLGTYDQKEGMSAFAEKRKPVFEGLKS